MGIGLQESVGDVEGPKIVVHTNDRLAGAGIVATLRQLPEASIDVTANESDLLRALENAHIDLVVVYFDSLLEDPGPALLRNRMRHSQATPVLAVLSSGLDDVLRALEMGVRGLVTKYDEPAVLVNTARALLNGECSLAPTITTHVVQMINETGRLSEPADQVVFDVLTNREQEIAQMLAMGMTTKEIATRTFITRATVKTHISNVLSKLNFDERSQIVAMVYRTGWLNKRLFTESAE
ncbi:helix-turn-helix transcriptional regulator [Saccharopolyspora gloriosae]|uniref:DNA-binding NarL/FixJ family response regulator n=1 Tax=Saccharopolyspora gloriosae TaxID=455344 RepID=A0A840NE48_9PSEU|nr:response regulator transcription factor [Saccharopolyspora gloriosae]MBB5070200.1 DNA-binding NarL/FixJ family response regulator [Saccharopolyspora gloriosae]